MIPTTLTVVGEDAAVEYPSPVEITPTFSERPLRVYTGEALFRVRITAGHAKTDTVELILSYQACDDSSCLPAVKKRISLDG
jgi:hypothetical protein